MGNFALTEHGLVVVGIACCRERTRPQKGQCGNRGSRPRPTPSPPPRPSPKPIHNQFAPFFQHLNSSHNPLRAILKPWEPTATATRACLPATQPTSLRRIVPRNPPRCVAALCNQKKPRNLYFKREIAFAPHDASLPSGSVREQRASSKRPKMGFGFVSSNSVARRLARAGSPAGQHGNKRFRTRAAGIQRGSLRPRMLEYGSLYRSMSHRVLIITYLFPPSGGIGPPRYVGYTRHLPAHGCEVSVIAPKNPHTPLD